jgi:hypothetical protein
VNWSPLPALLQSVPAARMMGLKGFTSLNRADRLLPPFKKFDKVAYDLAVLEGMAPLSVMVALLGVERVAFASYSPMFYFESVVKIREAALTTAQTAGRERPAPAGVSLCQPPEFVSCLGGRDESAVGSLVGVRSRRPADAALAREGGQCDASDVSEICFVRVGDPCLWRDATSGRCRACR